MVNISDKMPMRQNLPPFQPTETQKAFAKLIVNIEDNRSVGDKARSLGIGADKSLSWRRDSQFVAYINDMLPVITDSAKAEIWRVLIEKAKQGVGWAIKQYFEIKGESAQKQPPSQHLHIHTDAAVLAKARELKIFEALPESVKKRLQEKTKDETTDSIIPDRTCVHTSDD